MLEAVKTTVDAAAPKALRPLWVVTTVTQVLCQMLMPLAIEHGLYHVATADTASRHLADTLLLALQDAIQHGSLPSTAHAELRRALRMHHAIPCVHRTCSGCELVANCTIPVIGDFADGLESRQSWGSFLARATGDRSMCTLRELCLDVLRNEHLRSERAAQHGYAFETKGYGCVIIPQPEPRLRRAPSSVVAARRLVDEGIEKCILEQCRHTKICNGPLVDFNCKEPWRSCHLWEYRDCPDEVIMKLLEACDSWIVHYLAAPRPLSPLPPEIDETDVEIMRRSDGICLDQSEWMSESLPPLRGDTWHRDPATHQMHVRRWEDARYNE